MLPLPKKRILTEKERDDFTAVRFAHLSKKYRETCGDLVAIFSNQVKTPSGARVFLPDTPEWVLDLARKRNWSIHIKQKGVA